MDLTDRERQALHRIEAQLTAEAPRLARRLRAPALWRRLVWAPRSVRITVVTVGIMLLGCCTTVLIGALTAVPSAAH